MPALVSSHSNGKGQIYQQTRQFQANALKKIKQADMVKNNCGKDNIAITQIVWPMTVSLRKCCLREDLKNQKKEMRT